MVRKKLNEIKTLIVRLLVIAGIAALGYMVYRWFAGPSDGDDYAIEDTPLHVEEIRKIIELNTIRFRDEVVVDTVEYYTSAADQISGNFEKLMDPDQIEHGIAHSNVKRRLTLVMKGELLYGVDLKRKDFTVEPKENQLIIHIPSPELLSVSLTPENTDVFVENGEWKDYERQLMQRKARNKMIASGEKLRLREKAKEPVERLLKQLIRSDKQVMVQFE